MLWETEAFRCVGQNFWEEHNNFFFLRFGGEGKNIDIFPPPTTKSAVGDLPQYERGKNIVGGDFIFLSPERGHLL